LNGVPVCEERLRGKARVVKCLDEKNAYRWIDGEKIPGGKAYWDAHLKACAACASLVQCMRDFDSVLRSSAMPDIALSSGFETTFRNTILEREPWLSRVFKNFDMWVPMPALSQALGVALLALILGTTGGLLATGRGLFSENTDSSRRSIWHQTGFEGFKGLSSSSVAAVYLRGLAQDKGR
jgi:hypothetical protein